VVIAPQEHGAGGKSFRATAIWQDDFGRMILCGLPFSFKRLANALSKLIGSKPSKMPDNV